MSNNAKPEVQDLRIKRLTNTVGFLFSLDLDTEFRTLGLGTTANLQISKAVNTILEKKDIELLRDFFAHTAEHMEDI